MSFYVIHLKFQLKRMNFNPPTRPRVHFKLFTHYPFQHSLNSK